MIQPLARRLLGVPRPAHRHRLREEWIALSDGVRLATRVLLPVDPAAPRVPAVLVRTPFGSRARQGLGASIDVRARTSTKRAGVLAAAALAVRRLGAHTPLRRSSFAAWYSACSDSRWRLA